MSQKKTSRGRTHQSNLTFAISRAKSKLTASDKAMEANTSTDVNANTEKQSEGSGAAVAEGTGANLTEILAAINNMRAEFSFKFDGILTAIENVRKEISFLLFRTSNTGRDANFNNRGLCERAPREGEE